MGKRGPSPKPNSLRILEGTYRKDRHGEVDTQVKPNQPKRLTVPKQLGKTGREVWRRLSPGLRELGLLTENDLDIFKVYCRWHDRWQFASDAIDVDPTDAAADKLLAMATDNINRLGAKFGLSPSDRNGLTTEVSKQSPTVSKARKRG